MKDISKKENSYRLVGFMNVIGIVPDFVYPIFQCGEDNQKYYIQEGLEEELIITNFREVKQSYIDKVIMFKNGISTNEFSTKEISINSQPIFGFQDSEEHVQIGDSEEIRNFLNKFKTNDIILQEEIRDFLKIIG